MPLPRLIVLSLGGTITMTAGGQGGITPTLGAEDLIDAVPAIAAVADIEAHSLYRLPSSTLTLEHVNEAAREIRAAFAEGFDGAVVIQGTDSIEETAFALDLLINDEHPVVVTGAMRGPEAPGADGPANLLGAVIVAGSAAARGLGTLVVLNDEIHAARFVRKTHTALASTFASPDLGPLGLVVERRARFLARVPRGPAFEMEGPPPAVALLKIAMGDDGRLIRAVPTLGFWGLVIEGMGAGHVPADVAPMVGEVANHLPVVLATRTLGGPVFTRTYGYAGSEIDLIGRGLIPAGFLHGPKARLLLAFCLEAGYGRESIDRMFAAYR
ncbi:asparaginase [Ancylobacter sp. 6x-1]|uniref:Asparaginase n=1 Tax=Ancylobacter crimeensis TaxID=2579147 RepID=A0ABT0DGN8_9HYPH|nr:asparaginase [Ancylobacter crimeensis]MCK0199044.1 asparaginase [Ancylobacter crimeensis]